MGKRKNKTTQVKKESETQKLYFVNVLEAILIMISAKVKAIKIRRGGAAKYGSDAMFICATESLSAGHENRHIEAYIQAAAYAVAAAMQLMGQWEAEFAPLEKKEEENNDDNPSA